MTNENTESDEQVKGTAFGICGVRTMLSLLPDEAGSLIYDKRTPNFEGIALTFNPEPREDFKISTLEGTRQIAADYPKFVQEMNGWFGADKNWHGLEYNFVRAHFVDTILIEAVVDESPIQQIVFCGVGQDYRGMRYGEAIHAHCAKVFELDLPPMMRLRETIKAEICNVNETLVLPETHALDIDFGKQSLSEVLLACPHFDPTVPTLYLWEGVSYYLSPKSMRSFLRDVYELMCRAPPNVREHHQLFFDHLIDLPPLAAKGDIPASAMLEMFADSEPLFSFLDFDKAEEYMSSLGFRIEKQLTPPDMYKPYQTASNKGFCLTASKYFGMLVVRPTTGVVQQQRYPN